MTLFFADLVREFSYGTGAGPLPLSGAVPGHRPFAGAVPAGARFHYCIAGVTRPEQWETGEGEIQDGVLVRTPASSSAGGAAVTFAPGLKTVALTVTAQWFAAQEQGGSAGGGGGGGPSGIGDVDGLQPALDGLQAEIDGLETGVDGLQAEVVAIQTGLSGLQAEVGGIETGLGGLQAEVVGLEAGLDGLAAGLAGKQPLDGELTALAGLASAADRVPYFTGPGAAGLANFSAFGRSLVDDADAAAGRATLGLGAAAVKAIGTSGDAVPVLNGGPTTWSGAISAPGAALSEQLVINVAAAPSREAALRASASDAGNDALYLSNATAGAGQFLPQFTGIVDSADNVQSLGFVGVVAPARDVATDGGRGVIDFRAASTSNVVDPANGSFAALANRTLFSFRSNVSLVINITGTALNLGSGVVLKAAGTQVVGARRTGWSTPSGSASRASFDTSGVTTAQLAERVKALIDDLTAHGLIGS